ncbi:sporulation peptidase YabG [Clostridium saccharobutylicum]|uniref:Sporulation-specific protease YabG n=1 Tax=Clostridium saccharobutylicum DSM 13864 TaxID=1345695 RepID=U5MQ13_CLOSA|nr:sporulation peptidase YabG [Clostridium saccharobutylicum]AGX41507.1 sporulation-specific protease YabG [Clostridium saccharobutylicum DSM 13864]AQR88787.1 sporulation-specific protease YabG [Clostridium saccharobutylicum]AQR98685.1 sporulation-specific protease YabG [Clostridium saccharobutylicum]AQS12675.1 sporulation-specific protease YabG [Clostridium saccharobutylicum]MBA2904214.1 spore coat assembly protein [Clostridium saccharobutylicum]
MDIGDIVVRKSYDKDVTFKIIDIKENVGERNFILKGINIRIIADSKGEDLEMAEENSGSQDKILNTRVKEAIKNAVLLRSDVRDKVDKYPKIKKNDELFFGRPGKILHVDGDSEYMETCLKVYKQLALDAVGKAIPERKQPEVIVSLVKEIKPDIVVLTGHDSVIKDPKDYLDLDNYRNSKYYLESVKNLRNYNSSYDELVIFAGACQSCYERILDMGANFASSPNRVLIHCLDPVFVCEKIAYTRIDQVVSITDVIENTITGIKGVGGLQTRGKYREGYPKSPYI